MNLRGLVFSIVLGLMLWLALFEALLLALGYPEASVSARLRDLRKTRFGSYIVDREYVTAGLHRYRVRLPEPVQLALVAE